MTHIDQHLRHVKELRLVGVLNNFDDLLHQLSDLFAHSNERLVVIERSPR